MLEETVCLAVFLTVQLHTSQVLQMGRRALRRRLRAVTAVDVFVPDSVDVQSQCSAVLDGGFFVTFKL